MNGVSRTQLLFFEPAPRGPLGSPAQMGYSRVLTYFVEPMIGALMSA